MSASDDLRERIRQISNKRARTLAELILQHGSASTEDLEHRGYKHAPRAARDLRELGFALQTIRTKNAQGKTIAAYQFAESAGIQNAQLAGRRTFSKAFKQSLIDHQGARCAVCNAVYEPRYLQIDHRVPYAVGGDSSLSPVIADFQLLCASCNRAKSWSCEHCENWNRLKQPALCATCYWGSPLQYEHIALRLIRRLDILWEGEEVNAFDTLRDGAKAEGVTLQEYIKQLLRRSL